MPCGVYLHKPISKETRLKMAASSRGKKRTLEQRKRISIGHIGIKHSDITRKKMSLSHIGVKFSKEHCLSISKSKKGNKCYLYIDGRTSNKKYRTWIKNSRNRKKRLADGNHTYEEWKDLILKYKQTCPCCKRKEPEIKLTEDHIIPLSKGGSNNIDNIQPLCLSCNCKKNNKIIKYENNKKRTNLGC